MKSFEQLLRRGTWRRRPRRATRLQETRFAGIQVEPPVPHKAGERHSESQCQLDSKARWRAPRGQHGDAGHERFLHQLETRAAADLQDAIVEGRAAARVSSWCRK